MWERKKEREREKGREKKRERGREGNLYVIVHFSNIAGWIKKKSHIVRKLFKTKKQPLLGGSYARSPPLHA